MIALLAAALAGAACLCFARALWIGRERRSANAPPVRRTAAASSPATRILGALERLRRLAPGLVRLLARRESRLAIDRAGLTGRITPRDVAAARAACVVLGLLLAPRVAAMLPGRMLLVGLPALLFGMAELPMLLLARRGRLRAAQIRAALPDALDLMRACLAAGLPLRRSLFLVASHCAEPVASEFACVTAETALGVPQQTALDGLAARNPEPEVRSLVTAIRQAERNGSPLAPVIAAQARDARLALNREIVERGARAGPKIQLIVSATIVPGALLAFAAIVIAAIARGELKIL